MANPCRYEIIPDIVFKLQNLSHKQIRIYKQPPSLLCQQSLIENLGVSIVQTHYDFSSCIWYPKKPMELQHYSPKEDHKKHLIIEQKSLHILMGNL